MSKVIQPFLYILTGGVLAYVAYRAVKDAWDNPPPEEYVPDGVEAELFMDSNPDLYPDFQMQWDE